MFPAKVNQRISFAPSTTSTASAVRSGKLCSLRREEILSCAREGNMRWKENRIRQEIPLAHLKHPKSSANGAGAHGAYPLGWNGTSVLFLEQTPGTRSEKRIRDRKEKNRLPPDHSTCRPFSCLPGCLALGVLRPVRNPPMMPLSKPEVKIIT
jgi:hypothetical protein